MSSYYQSGYVFLPSKYLFIQWGTHQVYVCAAKFFIFGSFPREDDELTFDRFFAIEFRCILAGFWKLKSSKLFWKTHVIPRNDHKIFNKIC